jgi:hypothetical protein
MSEDGATLAQLYQRYHHPRAANFYALQRRDGYRYTLAAVKEFLRTQSTAERFTPYHKPSVYFPINHAASKPFERVQVDLMDMRNYNGHQSRPFGFVMVDIFSRYALVVPITGKGLSECGRALRECLQKVAQLVHYTPSRIDCDSEAAFQRNNSSPQSFGGICSANHIEIHQALYTDNGTTTALAHDVRSLAFVDRFIRTLRDQLNRYYHSDGNRTKTWMSELKPIIQQYNQTKHKSLKMTPAEVVAKPFDQVAIRRGNVQYEKTRAETQPWARVTLAVGDHVRVLLNRTAFDKGTNARWSDNIYPIVAIREGVYYEVNDKLYRKYELLKTEQRNVPARRTQDDVDSESRAERLVAAAFDREGVEPARPIPPTRARKRNRDGTAASEDARANALTGRRTRYRSEVAQVNILPVSRRS